MAETKTVDGITYSDYLADTPESMQNERRALLALMAEHGTEGQAELVKAQEAARATRSASVERAAARGAAIHAPSTLAAEIGQEDERVMAGLLDAQQSSIIGHGREMDRIAAANAAYLEQVGGAAGVNADLLAQALANINAGTSSGGGGGGGSSSGGGYSADATIPGAAAVSYEAGMSIGEAVQAAAAQQQADREAAGALAREMRENYDPNPASRGSGRSPGGASTARAKAAAAKAYWENRFGGAS